MNIVQVAKTSSIMTAYILLSIILQRFKVLSVSWAQPLLRTISKMALISLPALCRIKQNMNTENLCIFSDFQKIQLKVVQLALYIIRQDDVTNLSHIDHVSHESKALQFELRDICLQQHINLRNRYNTQFKRDNNKTAYLYLTLYSKMHSPLHWVLQCFPSLE